jgi:transglutaminase-like putative cysteine protease
VIYDIKHVTNFSYEASVAATRCAIRLLPRAGGGQTVERCEIETTPVSAAMVERSDFFGNRVVDAAIDTAHAKLRVALSARVAVTRSAPPSAGLAPAWEIVREAASASSSLAASSPVHWLFPSRRAPLDAAVTEYTRASFAEGRPILEGALELACRIKADFDYDPAATDVSTPLAEAFAARGGVCQDFAHIMIAGLRGLGLPAAYVSGYLRTVPAPGLPRREGADASHAWTSVWCGAELGWIDLDPTNGLIVADEHIVVAVGRDYADVAPIDGVLIGAGKQSLEVQVDIVEVATSANREIRRMSSEG